MNIRRAIAADVPYLFELERECPTAAHWTLQRYEQAVRESDVRLCLAVEDGAASNAAGDGASISGFLVARPLDREWELENIVVAPSARRTGLGTRLVERLLAEVGKTNGECVFLEVRASNHPARRLYEKMGFLEAGQRSSYYSNPQEDAVVYRWSAHVPGRE